MGVPYKPGRPPLRVRCGCRAATASRIMVQTPRQLPTKVAGVRSLNLYPKYLPPYCAHIDRRGGGFSPSATGEGEAVLAPQT